jgi:rhamnogalacturonyl hydrolase YesR
MTHVARIISLFFAALTVGAPAAAGPGPILALSEHVANWQLAHMNPPKAAPETTDPRGWVQGAFFVGLTALADVSPDPAFAEAVLVHGKTQNWGLGPRPFHADDTVIAQSWIWAYEHARDPRMIAPVRTRFDAIIAAAPNGTLDFGQPAANMEDACQSRWCWSDALFMAPPAWFALSRATGDPKYRAYADKEYWATVKRLYSEDEHLFYRDTRFFSRRGPHGEKIFWSRGNGWVYAGLARILAILPADAPERPRYIALFREISARLITLQKPDGTWPVSLLTPAKNTPPETSGTGFFTAGLAYGVASGLLADPKYRAAAEKGWAALAAAVEPDGKLGWVQQIGNAPDQVAREDTQLYGTGAFLLAGAAMVDMERPHPVTRLTLHNPLAAPRSAARIDIPAQLLPNPCNDYVAILGSEIAPLQRTASGAMTVLDLPAQATLKLALRPRFGFNPPPSRFARATIPVKSGTGYREVESFTVPPTHTIHDPLLPIEGAGWESDRVAFRLYLDKRNVTDIYGKKLPDPVLHWIGQGGPSYHEENDWGMDVWPVGESLGAGGLGVLKNGMATQIGPMQSMTATVSASGPLLADLHVTCANFTLNNAPRTLTADYSIAAGSRLSRITASAPNTPLVAGFGKFPNTVFFASHPAKGWGYLASWGRQSENGKDDVGVALFYPVAEIARSGDDGRSYYIVFKNPAKARYAFAAAWTREGNGLPTEAAFRTFVTRTAQELSNPLTVTR